MCFRRVGLNATQLAIYGNRKSTQVRSSTLLVLALVVCTSIGLTACTDEPSPAKPAETKKEDPSLEKLAFQPSSESRHRAKVVFMQGHTESRNWQDYEKGAMKALEERDYDAAEYLLDDAIKLNSKVGYLYDLRGKARANSSRTDNKMALDDFIKAKESGALSGSGFTYMARLYDGLGEPQKAIEILDEGIKKYPKVKELYRARAGLHSIRKEVQKAKEDYDKAIELDSTDALTYILRGQTNELLGKFEDALKDYKRAAAIPVQDRVEKKAMAHKSRAVLLAKLGRHKEALEESKNLKGDNDADDILTFRGNQYLELKMYDAAIKEFSTAIQLDPDSSRLAYESRAKAYAALGKLDLAESDRATAKKLDDQPAEQPLYKLKRH